MDWNNVITPLFTFLAALAGGWFSLKGKKLDISDSNSKAIGECQKNHTARLEEVRNEFNERFDDVGKSQADIKSQLLRVNMTCAELKKDLERLDKKQDKFEEYLMGMR